MPYTYVDPKMVVMYQTKISVLPVKHVGSLLAYFFLSKNVFWIKMMT